METVSENAGGPAAATASADAVAELTRQLQEKTKKIEKLGKYITNLETDGDRLNRELIVANSHKTCFESITNPLFMVNSSLQIEFANKAFCDFVGSTPEAFQSKPSCSEVLNCGTFRKRCLLKECFATKQRITGVKCNFVSAAGRKFAFLVDALPIHNIATNEILGGFEIFREVDEDTVRKYLMFESGDHQYGVDVKRLKCILRLPAITPMVNVSGHVRGVINLRGQIIPIYDLNCILGLKPMESSERQCVLLFEAWRRVKPDRLGLWWTRCVRFEPSAPKKLSRPLTFAGTECARLLPAFSKSTGRRASSSMLLVCATGRLRLN